jgi:hypothetical protein
LCIRANQNHAPNLTETLLSPTSLTSDFAGSIGDLDPTKELDQTSVQGSVSRVWQSQVNNALSTMTPSDDNVEIDGLQHFSLLLPK